jgi:hypothetical protein
MSDTHQSRPGRAATERYEALFRVSQTLISIRSSEELFRLLARELRAVVSFYVMGVGIYYENAHQIHLTSYGEPGVPLQVPQFTPEETFTWWVYQHQQPLIIPSLDSETRFPAVAEMLKDRGVRSVCVLPLTTVHRRIGGLALGSTEVDAYSKEEVSFLSFVANQVALAVDDALNFDALQHAEQALRASEQGFRLIVDSIPGLVNTTTAAGSGSGRGWYSKATTSDHYKLDVRQWQRDGLLVAGRSFVCEWWTVEVCSSMHLKPNRVFLSHAYRKGEKWTVWLEWTSCNYGGARTGSFARAVGGALRFSTVPAHSPVGSVIGLLTIASETRAGTDR